MIFKIGKEKKKVRIGCDFAMCIQDINDFGKNGQHIHIFTTMSIIKIIFLSIFLLNTLSLVVESGY